VRRRAEPRPTAASWRARVARAWRRRLVTRFDRLALSTRDLLNILAKIAERGATFKSLADAWRQEAVRRRSAGAETLTEIERSYNVKAQTIWRLSP
jgi:Resolvase, N terminal domain